MDEAVIKRIRLKSLEYQIFRFCMKNRIFKFYTCSRNAFDDLCEDAINGLRPSFGLKLIKVEFYKESFSMNNPLVQALNKVCYTDIISPLENAPDISHKYRMLYHWLIEQCDIMLTYITEDNDISVPIKEVAEEKGLIIVRTYKHINMRTSTLRGQLPFFVPCISFFGMTY